MSIDRCTGSSPPRVAVRIATVACVALALALALAGAAAAATNKVLIRPYLKYGVVLTPPGASDFEFVSVGGGNLDDALDVERATYGAGTQLLMPFGTSASNAMRFGLDVGVERLFNYEFQASSASTKWTGKERGVYFGVIGELAPVGKSYFGQAGIAYHTVFWSEESEFHGLYSTSHDSYSGSGSQFALSLAGGVELGSGEKVRFPLMVQLDNLFRYGSVTSVRVMAGVSFR